MSCAVPSRTVRVSIHRFLASASAAGVLLMLAALLALLVANSPAAPAYFALLATPVAGLTVLHWINDALMAGFFLLVGLEIKREALTGQLSSRAQRVLPGLAALGGVLVPALIYLAINGGQGGSPQGWAIPAATDIAFALGVLALLGPTVPVSLKVFLTALAIIDDLVAVLIIALFYVSEVDLTALSCAAAMTAVLWQLNTRGVRALGVYLVAGAALWFFLLRSGVHPTLAGVLLALAIPLRLDTASGPSPLLRLEHRLQPWVAFLVVPIFGFANAGVSLYGTSYATLLSPVPLGVAVGLFIGKQVGIFGMALLAIKLRLAPMPAGANWGQLYGISILCGIGFTMSLFIGPLAFPDAPALQEGTRIGVLSGSLAAALCGALAIVLSSRKEAVRCPAGRCPDQAGRR